MGNGARKKAARFDLGAMRAKMVTMTLGYHRERKRTHFWRGLFRWLVVLALGFAAGVLAERYGSFSGGKSALELEAEVAQVSERAAGLTAENAQLRDAAEADAARIAEIERRYEQDIAPTEARNLLDALRERLDAGVEESRLAFVIGAARNERACAEAPVTRRFVVQTPIYDGPNDSVSFAENTITVTAEGRSATDEAGNPEAWFDPVHAITLTFTEIGGESTGVEGTLPLHHALVRGGTEYRFTIVPGDRAFIEVTAEACAYP